MDSELTLEEAMDILGGKGELEDMEPETLSVEEAMKILEANE